MNIFQIIITENVDFKKKSPTNQHMYFNMYVALFDQFVIQGQGQLNLCFSVNS
jgi:hypothetical protein